MRNPHQIAYLAFDLVGLNFKFTEEKQKNKYF
jgi:hypothetical protein